jgi:C4-dicarboxylate-specific signal transduction histidine kinase
MAKTLGGEAEHEAEKLADAEPDAEVKTERDEAVQLAGRIASLFSQLQTFPGEEAVGARVQKRMREAKEEADAIAERLTGEEP